MTELLITKNHTKMKKISSYIFLIVLLPFSSCSLFELDNYEPPAEALQGEVVDAETGEPVLTDQGSEGIRVRLIEESWGENVTPNPDIYCMPDGTFQHTKLFKGTYNIRVDGPFIPIVREDDRGVPLADESQTLEINGITNVKFEVQPFLKVEFVGKPEVINGKIKAQVRVTRAVSEEDFRAKIEPMGDYSNSFVNVTDIQLFVSYSSSVGYRARDERWSSQLEYSGAAFSALLGQTITIESKGTIPSGRAVFVRAAGFETSKIDD
jgi:hypothetical protein